MAESSETVLVTGGTGFVGSWCIARLLEQGYSVRTTVRDMSRESAVRTQLANAGARPGDRLKVTAANLSADDGWAEAAEGCRYVLHVASPFPPKQPKDPDELIVPARDGALRVLGAALDAGAERVVLTSSVAAVRGNREDSSPQNPLTEADWTDPADTAKSPYTRSKAAAEGAAWEFVVERGARERLATIEPGAIIGPALSGDTSFSLELVSRLLDGMPAMPRLGFSFVDVRDVADLHVRAMTAPEAGGERFIATDEFLWVEDIAAILRERLDAADAKKIPTRNAPNALMKLMGIFDASVRSIVPDLGEQPVYSSAKAREQLGWQPRPVVDSVTDTARSLIEHGVAGPRA